ncbi:SDR family oxidoreductase [Tropicimonas marinistellae]|uniref:SDR family oxidoreductase n=1 Tax=Tropicimonas marinistellae TaxID=1739787 RepID=UPI00191B4D5E|nr:SDR family oxidoreductase [Tropicimonas marinistellae]
MPERSAQDLGLLLVTGASSGIGAASAIRAARDGWDVAVHFNRDAAGAETTATAVRAAGRKAWVVQADLGTGDDIPSLFAAIDETGRPLRGLVNNAGIVERAQRVDEMTAERVERMMRVNVVAPILVAGEAVRRMSTAFGGQGGAIVNVSSLAARLGGAGQYVDYAASKGAIDSFTKGLAREVAGEGIRVNAVRPGIIETAIHAKGGQPDRAAQLGSTVPVGRAGTADEIAETIVWLLGPGASYVTGALLDAGGGR